MEGYDMHADWVKRRVKVFRRILNSLKSEEQDFKSKGVIVNFENVRNEIQKILDEVGKIPIDETKPEKNDESKDFLRKSGYVIRKSRSS